jgi:hypothetical protein
MQTEEKVFTAKQIYILVFAIVVAIAFLESDSWRIFGVKVILYGCVIEFVVIALAGFLKEK